MVKIFRRIIGKQPCPCSSASIAIRRRIRGKRPPSTGKSPVASILQGPTPGEQAIATEAWASLTCLLDTCQRQHVHWTMVQTKKKDDVQPKDLTRAQYFEHICRIYAEVYPEPANRHKSILLFGAVASELCKPDENDERHIHHHCPSFCSKRHYWKALAKLSYDKYKVRLHAATHSGYARMYSYITESSAKKPLSGLDAEVWLSVDHPRGDALRRLLEVGETQRRAFVGRRCLRPGADEDAVVKRYRRGDVYDIVVKNGSRSGLEIQALAATQAATGDFALAEFCTSIGEEELEKLVRNAVGVIDAEKRLEIKRSTRIDLMYKVDAEGVCTCGGVWKAGALNVLAHQGEDVAKFCEDVCRALELGAVRGCNMAIIGDRGCGKSMVFEPFDEIFSNVMGKPDSKSTFPLSNILDAQLLLWNEYMHKDSILLFGDL